MTRELRDELHALQENIAEATKQARLAYRFCPGSYTTSALNACLRAAKNLRAVLDATSPQSAGPDAAQRLERERSAQGPRINLD